MTVSRMGRGLSFFTTACLVSVISDSINHLFRGQVSFGGARIPVSLASGTHVGLVQNGLRYPFQPVEHFPRHVPGVPNAALAQMPGRPHYPSYRQQPLLPVPPPALAPQRHPKLAVIPQRYPSPVVIPQRFPVPEPAHPRFRTLPAPPSEPRYPSGVIPPRHPPVRHPFASVPQFPGPVRDPSLIRPHHGHGGARPSVPGYLQDVARTSPKDEPRVDDPFVTYLAPEDFGPRPPSQTVNAQLPPHEYFNPRPQGPRRYGSNIPYAPPHSPPPRGPIGYGSNVPYAPPYSPPRGGPRGYGSNVPHAPPYSPPPRGPLGYGSNVPYAPPYSPPRGGPRGYGSNVPHAPAYSPPPRGPLGPGNNNPYAPAHPPPRGGPRRYGGSDPYGPAHPPPYGGRQYGNNDRAYQPPQRPHGYVNKGPHERRGHQGKGHEDPYSSKVGKDHYAPSKDPYEQGYTASDPLGLSKAKKRDPYVDAFKGDEAGGIYELLKKSLKDAKEFADESEESMEEESEPEVVSGGGEEPLPL